MCVCICAKVGSKSKSKIVMFGSIPDAVKCINHWGDENNTMSECKVTA